MSKPNKCGMNSAQLIKSRASRYRTPEKEEEARRQADRERNPEFYAILDAVKAGEISVDEGTTMLNDLQERQNDR